MFRNISIIAFLASFAVAAHAETFGPVPGPVLKASVARLCATPDIYPEARKACETGVFPTVTADGTRFSGASRLGAALNATLNAIVSEALAR